MERLVKSSKFWGIVMGIIVAIVMQFSTDDNVTRTNLSAIIALLSGVGGILYAVLTAFEDMVLKWSAGEPFDLMDLIIQMLQTISSEDVDKFDVSLKDDGSVSVSKRTTE